MSETERVRGVLRIVNITEEEAKLKCMEQDIERYGDDISWIDTLCDESESYCCIDGVGVCAIEKINRTDNLYGCTLKMNDNIIEFDAIYYNGGAHWTEVVEDAITKKRGSI